MCFIEIVRYWNEWLHRAKILPEFLSCVIYRINWWLKVNQLVKFVWQLHLYSTWLLDLPPSQYQRHWIKKPPPACWVQLFFFLSFFSFAWSLTTHLQAAAPLMAHLLKEGLLFPRSPYKTEKGLTCIIGHDSTGTCYCESMRGWDRVYLCPD